MSNIHFPSFHLRIAPSGQLSFLPLLPSQKTVGSLPGSPLCGVPALQALPSSGSLAPPATSSLSAASSPFADSSPHSNKKPALGPVAPSSYLTIRLPQTDIQLSCLIPSPTPPSLNLKYDLCPHHIPQTILGKLSSQSQEPHIHHSLQLSVPCAVLSLDQTLPWVSTAPRSSASFSKMYSIFILLLFHPP